jgi:Molecular chaperone
VPYIIGIDLGTTNCGLAYADTGGTTVTLFAIPQLINPGEVRDESLLPSFLFLPGPGDFPPGAIALPWNDTPAQVTGTLAQKRGAENAGRLVSSAKSWLSHSGVDRTSSILPLSAPEGVGRISPVAASRAYLDHLREAWNSRMPEAPFEQQQILVTVPASFDALPASSPSMPRKRPDTRIWFFLKSRRPLFTPGWKEIRTGANRSK